MQTHVQWFYMSWHCFLFFIKKFPASGRSTCLVLHQQHLLFLALSYFSGSCLLITSPIMFVHLLYRYSLVCMCVDINNRIIFLKRRSAPGALIFSVFRFHQLQFDLFSDSLSCRIQQEIDSVLQVSHPAYNAILPDIILLLYIPSKKVPKIPLYF